MKSGLKFTIKLVRNNTWFEIRLAESCDSIFPISEQVDSGYLVVYVDRNPMSVKTYYKRLVLMFMHQKTMYKFIGNGGTTLGEFTEFEVISDLEDYYEIRNS